jgi:hypothetical protein
MYTTCQFCHAALGSNDVIEHFPVGRRLAFDADLGRLWVVCPRCERWNLSPLEERWEAIEEAERQYRATSRRVATDNIALARLAEGLELVRIGRPLRPEFAAWRYGDQFGRRRRRLWAYSAVGAAVAGGVMIGGPAVGIGVGALSQVINVGNLLWHYSLPTVSVKAANGDWMRLSRADLFKARWEPREEGEMLVRFRHQRWVPTSGLAAKLGVRQKPLTGREDATLVGEDAVQAMARLLPALNRGGGGAREVEQAVGLIEDAGDVRRVFDRANRSKRRSALDVMTWTGESAKPDALVSLTRPVRLALEMALHEDDERRAMSGELGALYARWEEAERVARIADRELSALTGTATGDVTSSA